MTLVSLGASSLRNICGRAAPLSGCLCQSVRHMGVYEEPRARAHLAQFKGGSVDLVKDDETQIASIILNRPEKMNALTGSMMVDLHDIVGELEGWKTGKGVALYGAGHRFCSGADLELIQLNMDSGKKGVYMSQFMQFLLTRLHNLPLISCAMVQGQALGGGMELLTACDFRVVSERVSMGFLHSKLGITTGFGGGTRLVKLLGRRTALELISSARILSWKEGLDIGLVDAVLPENDRFLESGMQWLADHLKHDTSIVQATKRMVVSVEMEPNQDVAFAKEAMVFSEVWGSALHRKMVNQIETQIQQQQAKNKK